MCAERESAREDGECKEDRANEKELQSTVIVNAKGGQLFFALPEVTS